jgi:hypothetical protein
MNKLIQSIANVTFDEVSQFAHFFTAYAIVLTGCFFGLIPGVVAAIGMFLFAIIKEFWFDMKYEDEATRGSSPRDFIFYCLGAGCSLAVFVVKLSW